MALSRPVLILLMASRDRAQRFLVLASEVLGVGRDAGITENHARHSATDICNKKAQLIQRPARVSNILISASLDTHGSATF